VWQVDGLPKKAWKMNRREGSRQKKKPRETGGETPPVGGKKGELIQIGCGRQKEKHHMGGEAQKEGHPFCRIFNSLAMLGLAYDEG